MDRIEVRGARTHNLKNINLDIPRDKLTVITGLSGSGKSSLAFDTLYAEGQRRYVESLSSYARQFLNRMKKPDVDYIKGICPAIAVERVLRLCVLVLGMDAPPCSTSSAASEHLAVHNSMSQTGTPKGSGRSSYC